MKALTQDRYGGPDLLVLDEVDTPVPAPDEVLVRVQAVGLNAADWHVMRGEPFLARMAYGLRRPKHRIPGSDVAGVVEAVGARVAHLSVGDVVMSETDVRGMAELVAVREEYAVPAPSTLTIEQAAALPLAGLTALRAVRDCGQVQAGQRVLVNGASGGVGHYCVQLAHHLGAHVTGVCSTANVDLVRACGADVVVDYTREDPLDVAEPYDVIIDIVANHPLRRFREALTRRGRYVAVGAGTGRADHSGKLLGPAWSTLRVSAVSPFVSQTLVPVITKRNRADVLELRSLAERGALRPHVARTYPLADAPAALAHLEDGHVAGKLVLTL
jgi:NADPH:quinone reductase-like Zn-dependent oxidoreductase